MNGEELLGVLRSALPPRYRIRREGAFLMLLPEKLTMRLDIAAMKSVVVEIDGGLGQIVFLATPWGLRFWLTTSTEPTDVDTRLNAHGVVGSSDGAILLCEEFLGRDVAIADLTTTPDRILGPLV